MKKFLQEFKAFALKGNVMDMAIGVIIGAAFGAIVTSFTESFINPLIACIGGTEIAGRTEIGNTGQYLEWGNFITAVINFLIMAFCIFLMMKGINKLMSIGKRRKKLLLPSPLSLPRKNPPHRNQRPPQGTGKQVISRVVCIGIRPCDFSGRLYISTVIVNFL